MSNVRYGAPHPMGCTCGTCEVRSRERQRVSAELVEKVKNMKSKKPANCKICGACASWRITWCDAGTCLSTDFPLGSVELRYSCSVCVGQILDTHNGNPLTVTRLAVRGEDT